MCECVSVYTCRLCLITAVDGCCVAQQDPAGMERSTTVLASTDTSAHIASVPGLNAFQSDGGSQVFSLAPRIPVFDLVN